MCLDKGKYNERITEVHVYQPIPDQQGQEKLVPFDDNMRLCSCPRLFLHVKLTTNNRDYLYQIRYKNNADSFILTSIFLEDCDIFPEDKGKDMEGDMKDTIDVIAEFLLSTLLLLEK